jgi:hypothetical protein
MMVHRAQERHHAVFALWCRILFCLGLHGILLMVSPVARG